MTPTERLYRLQALMEIGAIRKRDGWKLLGLPRSTDYVDLDHLSLLDSSSRVGQTWEALSDFSVDRGCVYTKGYVAWPPDDADPIHVAKGDHLLVVSQELALKAQSVLHLESGRVFKASGWQAHAMLVGDPEGK